jgi:hypothetical protein
MKNISNFSIILLLTSCTTTTKFALNSNIEVPSTKKINKKVGLYISENTKTTNYVGNESSYGTKTNIIGNIGEVFEANVLKVLSNQYSEVIILKDKNNLQNDLDYLIELGFGTNQYKCWQSGPVFYRKMTVELVGKVYNKENTTIATDTISGECNCKKYECEVNGKVKGEKSGKVLVKTLLIPNYSMDKKRFQDLYSLGTTAHCNLQ